MTKAKRREMYLEAADAVLNGRPGVFTALMGPGDARTIHAPELDDVAMWTGHHNVGALPSSDRAMLLILAATI